MTASGIRAGVLAIVLALGAWAWADEVVIVNTLPGTWIDISQSGTNLHLGDDDFAEVQTTIGNSLLPTGRVVVSNNGGIGFDPPDPVLSRQNEHIPSQHAFGGGQSLFIYWSDIGNDIGGTFFQEMGDRYVVQWNHRPVPGTTGFITMQIQVFDGSESTNPYFQFLYQEVESVGGGAQATIGYQDGGAGFNDDEWSFNTPGAVADGGVLSVLPEPHALFSLLILCAFAGRR